MLKNLCLLSGIFLSVFISYFSLKESIGLDAFSFPFIDKVMHLSAYVALTLVWSFVLFLFKPDFKFNKILTIILSVLMIYGIIIEILQSKLTNTRVFELNDLVANLIGIILGLIIFKHSLKFKLKNK